MDCTAGTKLYLWYQIPYRLYKFNGSDDRNTFRDDRQYFILVSWPISGFLKIVHKNILMGYRYSFPNS